MNALKIAVLSFALVFGTSCSILQKLTCNTSSASRVAAEDVLKGDSGMGGIGSAKQCEGAEFTPAQYEAEYRKAFDAKKAEVCQEESASAYGYDEGTKGTDISSARVRYRVCGGNIKAEHAFTTAYNRGFCSVGRAERVGYETGKALKPATEVDPQFTACTGNDRELAVRTARLAHGRGWAEAEKARAEEFQRTTGTASFSYQNKGFTSVCRVTADKARVEVDVNNPNPDQTLIQGVWRFSYYNVNYQKIADDQLQEVVLVPGQGTKSFSKLTLPRDASFCRSELSAPSMPFVR